MSRTVHVGQQIRWWLKRRVAVGTIILRSTCTAISKTVCPRAMSYKIGDSSRSSEICVDPV